VTRKLKTGLNRDSNVFPYSSVTLVVQRLRHLRRTPS
jgi:hypothetical protein